MSAALDALIAALGRNASQADTLYRAIAAEEREHIRLHIRAAKADAVGDTEAAARCDLLDAALDSAADAARAAETGDIAEPAPLER